MDYSEFDPLRRLFPLTNVDLQHPVRLEAGGPWRLAFPGSSHVRFGAVAEGFCWLTTSENGEPLRLERGEGYLLTRGQSYTIGSDVSLPAKDGVPLLGGRMGGKIRCGTGRSTALVAGRFTFDELSNDLLLQMLPPIVHLQGDDVAGATLSAAIGILDAESKALEFGASLVAHHVAQIMLVQALRQAFHGSNQQSTGWLAALADPRIGVAIEKMHNAIDHRWTLAELARAAGMSRSLFAKRFRDLSGSTPLDYLLDLRVRIATKLLEQGDKTIAEIAYQLGYSSESAFTVAFKRSAGQPPSRIRKSVSR
jgi:AraC-like DNA-binding protein